MSFTELLPYIATFGGTMIGTGSVMYLYMDKKVRSNGEKAEDRKKDTEAKDADLDFAAKLDKWQTEKLDGILRQLEEKNDLIDKLQNTIIKQNDVIKEQNEKIKELQEEIIKKNEEVIQAKAELSKYIK